jgi:hypothetical protein
MVMAVKKKNEIENDSHRGGSTDERIWNLNPAITRSRDASGELERQSFCNQFSGGLSKKQ